MKRNFIIRNIIISIILITIIAGLSYYFIKENGKKYEIAKVENYNYFVLKLILVPFLNLQFFVLNHQH